jgi:hypothetical protein
VPSSRTVTTVGRLPTSVRRRLSRLLARPVWRPGLSRRSGPRSALGRAGPSLSYLRLARAVRVAAGITREGTDDGDTPLTSSGAGDRTTSPRWRTTVGHITRAHSGDTEEGTSVSGGPAPATVAGPTTVVRAPVVLGSPTRGPNGGADGSTPPRTYSATDRDLSLPAGDTPTASDTGGRHSVTRLRPVSVVDRTVRSVGPNGAATPVPSDRWRPTGGESQGSSIDGTPRQRGTTAGARVSTDSAAGRPWTLRAASGTGHSPSDRSVPGRAGAPELPPRGERRGPGSLGRRGTERPLVVAAGGTRNAGTGSRPGGSEDSVAGRRPSSTPQSTGLDASSAGPTVAAGQRAATGSDRSLADPEHGTFPTAAIDRIVDQLSDRLSRDRRIARERGGRP